MGKPSALRDHHPMLKLLLLEDSRLIRPRMLAELCSIQGVTVVGSAGTIADFDVMCERLSPDLLIIDLSLPDGHSAEAIARWSRLLPTSTILVHSNDASSAMRQRCLQAGAHGYFDKSADLDPLLEAIANCAAGL